jgi:hypothetical protein
MLKELPPEGHSVTPQLIRTKNYVRVTHDDVGGKAKKTGNIIAMKRGYAQQLTAVNLATV